ncbi:MAG: universal stress protein [Deltaproteobacteria bacterium]|jgi:nucleotide-binding universal stress UspA family protein|nr:universal stress protein [Deltaproteobacteria bacterium]
MFSKMLTKILVPYDGSNYSVKALTRAIELAHNLDSQIFLISVVNVGYISPPGLLHGLVKSKKEKDLIKSWSKKVKADAEKMLKNAIKKCESKGISASFVIEEGDVAGKILDFEKKKKITLIVIGSHGLHGINKLKTLGSVSRKVSENAKSPVLIVR